MVRALNLWNFPVDAPPVVVRPEACFELRTCQRTLVLSFDERPFGPSPLGLHERAEGGQAYLFLLETICGLKSKLLGENEIVAQFKGAYQEYTSRPGRDGRLLLVLEKLFKDAKEIRSAHLVGLGMKTYASLTRRHFARHRAERVLILGSGQLAEDLINQFKKRTEVWVAARNPSRVRELVAQHGVKALDWQDKDAWLNHAYIANTIGFEGVLLDETFFSRWAARHAQRLLVDLGSPSCLSTILGAADGVLRLEHILAEGALVEEQKLARLELAREALVETAQRRVRWLEERRAEWHPACATAVAQTV